jgi:ADP-heptose:LPS heptosyltransferase
MYTQVVQRSRDLTPRHSVMNQWDLLEPLDIPPPDPAGDPLQMPDLPQAARRINAYCDRARIAPSDSLIVIHVSASTRFKRWPEDSFVSLVTRLVRQGANRMVFFTSGPSDAEAAQRIADAARKELGPLATAILESPQLTLPELRALIARAALFVGGDSGPLHIAATTSVPIVELLGPTLAERSFPWRDPRFYSEIIDPGELPCRPCHQRVCVPGDFRCLTGIGPDRVLAAAERALRSTVRSERDAAPATNERRIPVVH